MVLKKRQRALSEFGNMGVEQPETPVSNIGSPRKVSSVRNQCRTQQALSTGKFL